MENTPIDNTLTAINGIIAGIITVIGLIIRAFEKKRDKKKLKEDIRNGKENIYEVNE